VRERKEARGEVHLPSGTAGEEVSADPNTRIIDESVGWRKLGTIRAVCSH
jgi:hypothetical protein